MPAHRSLCPCAPRRDTCTHTYAQLARLAVTRARTHTHSLPTLPPSRPAPEVRCGCRGAGLLLPLLLGDPLGVRPYFLSMSSDDGGEGSAAARARRLRSRARGVCRQVPRRSAATAGGGCAAVVALRKPGGACLRAMAGGRSPPHWHARLAATCMPATGACVSAASCEREARGCVNGDALLTASVRAGFNVHHASALHGQCERPNCTQRDKLLE
jgi:hypothetical protein